MGRQVQLYLTPADLLELERELRSKLNFVCLNAKSDKPEPSLAPSFSVAEMGKTWLTLFLARTEDLDRLRFLEVPAHGYWTLDVLTEPVIEFARPYSDGALVRRGRIYYERGDDLEGGAWRAKSEGFIKWADTLLRLARMSLRRDATLDAYLGPQAWDMRLQGQVEFART